MIIHSRVTAMIMHIRETTTMIIHSRVTAMIMHIRATAMSYFCVRSFKVSVRISGIPLAVGDGAGNTAIDAILCQLLYLNGLASKSSFQQIEFGHPSATLKAQVGQGEV